MKSKQELPDCPVAITVQLLESKWKLLIIRDLLARSWRFNELQRDLDGISRKVLTASLRALEQDGLVVRTAYPEKPLRVEYALTPLGQSLRPVFDAMASWGEHYRAIISSPGSEDSLSRSAGAHDAAQSPADPSEKS